MIAMIRTSLITISLAMVSIISTAQTLASFEIAEKTSPGLSEGEEPGTARLFEDSEYIGGLENVEQRYKDDVVDIQISKEMQHRSLSFGEVTEQAKVRNEVREGEVKQEDENAMLRLRSAQAPQAMP